MADNEFTIRATRAAVATIDDLRGKARKSYENFEGELRKQGCMVAGYRLLAEDGGLSEYCCKRLVEDWRTILRTRRGPRRRAWPPRRPCLLCGPRKDARDRHKRTAAPREARLLRGERLAGDAGLNQHQMLKLPKVAHHALRG